MTDLQNRPDLKENLEPLSLEKSYYENNKEKFVVSRKKYYESHKEQIKQHNKDKQREKYMNDPEYRAKKLQKVKCELCDVEITKDKMNRHKQTKKHLNNVQSLTVQNI